MVRYCWKFNFYFSLVENCTKKEKRKKETQSTSEKLQDFGCEIFAERNGEGKV